MGKVFGFMASYPQYRVPKLAGQRPEYIIAALKAYQTGSRQHSTMQANASTLSEQDMQDLAAYLSVTLAVAKADVEAEQAKTSTCIACHGTNGQSQIPAVPGMVVPHIGGQYADYLVKALQDYRSGVRKNTSMSSIAAGLTDEDIEDLAAYYAGFEDLNVVSKP